MFSLKHLTKKFNRQTLSEVKPAPLSETVDHTLPSYLKPPSPLTSTVSIPAFTSSLPQASEFSDHTLPNRTSPAESLTDHPNHLLAASVCNHPESSSDGVDDPSAADNDRTIANDNPTTSATDSPTVAAGAVSASSASSFSSDSDSDDDGDDYPSPPLRTQARSPRKNHLSTQYRMHRTSSAEKRKYSQYKCSTGGSSPSSSDDEIKEAFESKACRLHKLSPPTHFSWAQSTTPQFSSPSTSFPTTTTAAISTANHFSSPSTSHPVSAWNIETARRPHKVVPSTGKHKHKFFAQMPSGFMDRPFLDFNKMQHSKRLVMVRRPMVIRNNSRVHSVQRPAPPSLHPLDISKHSFQPVLMQT